MFGQLYIYSIKESEGIIYFLILVAITDSSWCTRLLEHVVFVFVVDEELIFMKVYLWIVPLLV